jgi:hypothetical protein
VLGVEAVKPWARGHRAGRLLRQVDAG